jgi:tetratricopeptide (TPR) repeat protein
MHSDPMIEEMLARGIQFQRNQQLVEAEAAYHQVLALDPKQADAIHLLGMLAYQIGDYGLAVELILAAIEISPQIPVFHNNLGNAYLQLERPEDAQESYRRALDLDSNYPEALFNVAQVMADQGNVDKAIEAYQRLVEVEPNFAEAHNNLGGMLREQGKLQQAMEYYRRALELHPDYALARENLSGCLCEQGKDYHRGGDFDGALQRYKEAIEIYPDGADAYFQAGRALQDKKEYVEAVKYYGAALKLQPDLGEVYFNLGLALKKAGEFEEALGAFKKAVELKDRIYQAHCQMGNTLRQLHRLEEAEAALRKSIALSPDFHEGYNALGIVLNDMGRYGEAVEYLKIAVEFSPDTAQCHNNLAMAYSGLGDYAHSIECYGDALACIDNAGTRPLDVDETENEDPATLRPHIMFNRSLDYLAAGNLAEGWRDYEWRWPAKPETPKRHAGKEYSGGPLAGKTILLWGEQGLGDEILFANMIPDAVGAAGHVVIECDARLVPLFSRSFPEAEVIGRAVPANPRALADDVELQIPLGSLGQWFRPSLESFPFKPGFLAPDGELRSFWKARLDALGAGRKIGICWRSGVVTYDRKIHYSKLEEDWGEIFGAPGNVFVNLQYDRCDDEIAKAESRYGVQIHRWSDIDLKNDQDSVAALMSSLDLVISPATAVSAMAGALGIPCWQLSLWTNWTLLGRNDGISPWYPSMRFFKRAHGEDWQAVLGRMAAALRSS